MELTVVAKLVLSPQDKERLNRTLDVFAAACNAISQVAFGRRCFNPVVLHHLTYRDIRKQFGLHANLAIRARDRVAKAYKTLKANKRPLKILTFKAQSLELDARLLRLFLKGGEIWVSIAACDGKRVKCPIKVGQRYLPILKAQNPLLPPLNAIGMATFTCTLLFPLLTLNQMTHHKILLALTSAKLTCLLPLVALRSLA